jgi:hypothetical protein
VFIQVVSKDGNGIEGLATWKLDTFSSEMTSWATTLFGRHPQSNDTGFKVLKHVHVTSDTSSDDTIPERIPRTRCQG